MRLDLDRFDIHMGDYVRPFNAELDDGLQLSDLLREILLPYVPDLTEGWTFRAITDVGAIDVAESGRFNRSPRLLVDDTEIRRLSSRDTLQIGARPTGPAARS